MAEDLAALVIRLSAEGSEKVQKDISAIGANTKVTTDILVGMNNTLKKIERSGLIGLRTEFAKTQTASAQLSDQVKKQQATITELQNKLKTLGSAQVTTTKATKDHTAEIEKHGKGIRNLIPHVALVTLSYMAMRRAVRAVVETLTIGASFEHQMAIVGGIVRATTEEFEALSKAALKAGEETVWTATEAANALRYLGMAGLGTEDAIAALGGVLNLALIGEMNLSRATDIATDSLMAFGLKATELDKVVDVFVGTITRSNTNIEALGQAMKFAAPVASQLGYTIEQVSAMIGILSQSGIKAGIAGRALRMSLLRSADAAKELGLSSSNLIEILKELSDRNLAPDELAATMHKLFGIEATPSMLILMKNVAALEEFIDTLNNSAGETDAFIKRLDTVTVAWKEVASVIEDLAITAFLKYADSLKNGLKDLKGWIGDHKEDILGLFDDMVSVGKDIKEILIPALQATKVALSAIKEVTSTTDVGATTASVAGGVIGRYMFGSWTPAKILAVAYAVEILAGMLSKMSGIEIKGPFAKAKELIDDISKTGDDIKYAVKWWKDLFSTQTKGFDELAEEYDAVKPKVNALAVEVEELYEAVRIEAEEIGKAAIAHSEFQKTLDTHAIIAYKNAMAELSQLKWYELLPESDQKTDEIARLKAIADYEKQVVDELKSLWGSYYYQNEEKFKELTKHKVDAFTKLYDTQKSNTEKIKDIEDKYTQESGVLLSKFTNETYKQEILKQVNLYRESQISRLQATGEASDAAVKIAEETTKRSLEIFKEGLKNQKDSEKWFLDSKKELYKDDVAEQLKMLDEAYANYLNTHEDSLEAFEAYHAMRTKIYADAYKDEATALDAAMAEESKWMDGRIDAYAEFEKSKKQYRNDELQAMKSLYEELGMASTEYYQLLREATELEYEKYIEQLGLKLAAGQAYTQEQLKMLEILNSWKAKKLADPYEDLYKSAQKLFDTTTFGDGLDQSINNLMKSLEELSKMYEEIPKLLKKIEVAQQSLIDQDFSDITKSISESLKDFNLDDFFKDGKLLEDVSFDSFVDAFKKAYEEMGSIEQAYHADTLKRILEEQAHRNTAALNIQKTETQILSAQLAGYRQLFGTTSQLFDENTKAREAMHNAEMIFAAAEIAINIKKALVEAVAATAAQGSIPIAGFAMVAAMAAMMGVLLSQIGQSFSGGSGATPATSTLPKSTVLGAEPGTASESIQSSYDMLKEAHADEYAALIDIYNEVKQLNQNITGLVTEIIKGVGGDFTKVDTGNETWIGGAEEFWNSMTEGMQDLLTLDPLLGWITGFVGDLIGDLVSSIFGGGGWTDVQRVGIIFGQVSQSFADILAGGELLAKIFADIHKHEEGGWFSDDEETFWTEYKDLDQDVIRLLTKVFKSIGESFVTLAEGLGVDVQAVYDYIIPLTKLDLRDMNAEQINEAITAFFSNLTDQMAEDLFGDILKQYQKVGEGLYETAVRIVMEKEIFLTALEMTGKAFTGTAQEAIALSQAVISLAGDIDTLMENVEAYYSAFFSESEQQAFTLGYLTQVLADLGLTFPSTKDGFRDLIEGLDLSTEEGQKLYVALLAIAGAAGEYYDLLEDNTQTIVDAQRKLSGTETEGALQDIANRYGIQVENITQTWAQSIIDAFTSMSTEDVIAWANALGVSTDQLVSDIMALADAFDVVTQPFEEWKSALLGLEDELTVSTIADKYGLDQSKMTQDWWQSVLDWIYTMSEQQFNTWAASLGVSSDQLRSDINALNAAFDAAGDSAVTAAARIGELADEIRSVLDEVRGTISGGSGASTASGLLSQYQGLQQSLYSVATTGSLELAMQDLLSMAQLAAQWYDAAIQEAEDAARAAAEQARDDLEADREDWEVKRDLLQEELRVAQAFGNLVDQIDGIIESIKYSDLNVSLPDTKAQLAKEDYNTLKAAALSSGSVEDYQKFVNFAQTYLQQSQNAYKSSGAYQSIYDQVMADLESARGVAEAQSYDEAILSQLESIDAQIESISDQMSNISVEIDPATLAEINAQFELMATWIEAAMQAVQNLEMILTVDWGTFDGTVAEVLQMLLDLVAVYGWESEFILTWTSDMTAWLYKQPIEDIITFLGEAAAKVPGGWDSKYMLYLVSDLVDWLDDDLVKVKGVLDYFVSIFGADTWTKAVTIELLTKLTEGAITWAELKSALTDLYGLSDDEVQKILTTVYYNSDAFTSWETFMEAWNTLGMADSWANKYLKTFYENGSMTDEALKGWSDFVLAFKQAGVDDADAEKTLSLVYSYTGGDPSLALWSDFKTAMAESGIAVDSTAWKTIEAAYNDSMGQFPTYAELKEALANAGVSLDSAEGTALLKEIEGKYASGTMTWTELEEMLAATGLPAAVIRTIEADVTADVTTNLEEMDYWSASIGLMVWMGHNLAEIAKMMHSGTYFTWSNFAAFAPGVYDWAGEFSGGLGGTASTSSQYQTVYVTPTSGWSTHLSTIQSYLLSMKTFMQNWTYGTQSIAVKGVGGYEYGGISYGSDDGYLATLHGTELVVSPKASYPATVLSNGGSTQAGSRDEELELLREQNRLLAKLVTQSGQPLKIEGLGRYAKAKADEVIVARNERGKITDTRRYYQ